jgi:RNA polymerase sigma-70 factor (ECF subfamily)
MRTPTMPGGPIGRHGDERRVNGLLVAARGGDRDAMHALYVHFAPTVHAYVARIVGIDDAEDVTQQLFAKLMRELPQYRAGEAPFSAWLLRVARNLAIDHLRRSRLVPCAEVGERVVVDEAPRACAASLREALGTLPPAQTQVLLMRHLVGLSAAEIAERLGRSVHSVHCLDNRGRSAARTALDGLGAGPATRRQRVVADWPGVTPIAA